MSQKTIDRVHETNSLEELYPLLASLQMTPGWHKKRSSLWKQPRTEFRPLHWSYDVGRRALQHAGQWIGTDLAERRNFLLFNPVGDNDYDTVRTLVAAFQMIKPGEHARAHWHTPNAMRLVLDAGPGVFTVVDGVKLPMHKGDLLLTPGGCWHSHYNEGDTDAYWIDILDVPLVHLLEPMFFGEHPDQIQSVDSEPAEHPFYFPLSSVTPALSTAPVLDGMRRLTLNTEAHIATMGITYVKISAGFNHGFARNTASRILAVTQGSGIANIGGTAIKWARGDVIAVPSWFDYSLCAIDDAVLLDVSDEPVLRKLGFYREA